MEYEGISAFTVFFLITVGVLVGYSSGRAYYRHNVVRPEPWLLGVMISIGVVVLM